MHLSERINALWDDGLTEREIAPMLGISQRTAIWARRGRRVQTIRTAPATETRYGTINGGEGHMTCRRVPVTLAYTGTIH